MTEQPAIEGKVISTPGGGVQRQYNYYYRTNQGQSQSRPASPGGGGGAGTGGGGRIRETIDRASFVNRESVRVSVPSGVPRFLGNRTGLAAAWLVAMTLVSLDEWKRNQILPRPSRLWATSLFFLILAFVSMFDPVVPLVNLLAFGYVMMLTVNYFSGQGQFA